MSTSESSTEPAPSLNRNEDPLTHEPGAHPVAAGVGAAGGGATGAVVGLALGGPVGGVIGAVIGAFAGGLGGSAVGESISPTQENEAWPGEAESLREADAETLGEPPQFDVHEEIARRAYFQFEEEGRPEGQSLRHWLEAERSLTGH